MGYKVNYKGLEVICDTFEDLDSLAEKANNHKPKREQPSAEREAPIVNSQIENDDPPLWLFIKALPEKTIDVLSTLVANGAMTDTQLRAALTLDNNMQLAGRVAPVSRNAKKFGLKPESVLKTKMISNKPGARKYEYDVQDAAKSFIRRRTHGSGV